MQEELKAFEGLRRKLDWSGPYACLEAHSMIWQSPAKDLCSFGHMHQSNVKANQGIQRPACSGSEIGPDRMYAQGRMQSFCRSL
jgi:hypothetical protein